MTPLTLALVAVGTLIFVGPALAEETRADRRQIRQEKRIDQGVQSGQLTGREAQRVEAGQRHVEKVETKAQSDGVVTNAEKARLEKAQDVQSRRIYRQKHDLQTR
jgi:hypothetical protein